MDKQQAKKTFEDDLEGISVRKPKKAGATVTDYEMPPLDALLSDEERRSEIMTIRLTPSARKKIEKIWLQRREKNKSLKESSIAADLLIKILDQY